MSIKLYTAEACKNTFIIADCLNLASVDEAHFLTIHQHLVDQQCDDALILKNAVIMDNNLSIEMLVLGVDQSLGEFCGNGARACAAYLHAQYPKLQFYIKAQGRNYRLRHYGHSVYGVDLPHVNFIPQKKFIAQSDIFQQTGGFYAWRFQDHLLYYADVMEPHLILNERLSVEEVGQLGQMLNQNDALFPKGINLTVFYQQDSCTLAAVTYERGVQRLTQSCGTGACCAAVFCFQKHQAEIKVQNPGGTLYITNHQTGITLKGLAHIT
ncbi:hypothetical protein [Legionella londiniensis]|uniref:Diaminopimelate epimerase n=1 Tax=Legionella londiniensis TaxID=45068 RepID=A0A0W0VSG2_9GAMM|nr:hypothetical protein [Legionella londiniensis]KTD23025.1 Diaminopimelate epimerase [Legionella londiniensis]STX94042.1 diaminopimelate epimerase [Legionella londiniensis]